MFLATCLPLLLLSPCLCSPVVIQAAVKDNLHVALRKRALPIIIRKLAVQRLCDQRRGNRANRNMYWATTLTFFAALGTEAGLDSRSCSIALDQSQTGDVQEQS